MKKTFIFILTVVLSIPMCLFPFSANTMFIDKVENALDQRRNDVDEFKNYIYRLPADEDEPNVSIGYGHKATYRITAEKYRDWNAFVIKAEGIFAENMLYKALYNDWVRGEDGILYRFTPDGDLAFIEDIFIGTEIGYVKTFEFAKNVYCRYIQYDMAQGYSIYRVELWKYDKDSDEFYLLDSNNEGGFFRRGISDNRPEYKKEDYYLDYKGGVIEVGDFESYCTAVYHISRLMSDNKDTIGYDLSDENVSIKVTNADESTIKVEVTLPVYEGQKVIQENQALVIIDKHFYSDESEKKYDYYDDAIGYHTHSEIIYEEITGNYVESPDTSDIDITSFSVAFITLSVLIFIEYQRRKEI